ncbi:hypothetical protein [uncultured Selenomonas sp.]|uniref:hypothetical protein n=1 Tax=uncultured Selenomonas sp. TaxID=159275 RepID=UPI0025E225AD|nr:hypothetical protein [uncultured Selenomonas sp.]
MEKKGTTMTETALVPKRFQKKMKAPKGTAEERRRKAHEAELLAKVEARVKEKREAVQKANDTIEKIVATCQRGEFWGDDGRHYAFHGWLSRGRSTDDMIQYIRWAMKRGAHELYTNSPSGRTRISLLKCDEAFRIFDEMRNELSSNCVTYDGHRFQFWEKLYRERILKEYGLTTKAQPTKTTAAKAKTEAETIDATSFLLDCDKIRADMASYPPSVLTDTEQGHWDLVEGMEAAKALPKNSPFERVQLPRPMVARPPQMDVHESGTCAIDFGTKSTVVACRDKGERLLRIGKGNFDAAPQPGDYENPTVMEFRDIAGFRKAYAARDGRPFTEWEQMTVSHHARGQLLNAEHADGRASFFSELKQWANNDSAVRHVKDGKGFDLQLPAYTTLADGAFDPIEYYAYVLGLYINNMMKTNGIYLDYVLSYPVKYPKDVCERIRQSFERGLKKSLPPAILHDEALMQDFRVYLGASEPAAYASCALQELSETYPALEPGEGAPVAYAVFDFGGGTTDFDYGIWRLPTDDDGGHWNYVLETFAAGSDPHLGGEKLLDQLAYRVYQDNLPAMRKEHIPIVLPEDAQPFAGGERLINASDAAYMNLKQLAELLRPVWEDPSGEAAKALGGEPQSVTLFTDTAEETTKTGGAKAEGNRVVMKLDIKIEPLQNYLCARIQRGIDNFFTGLWHAFQDDEIRQIHILLAGNSCRSQMVQELFRAAIDKAEAGIEATGRKMRQPGSAKGMLVLYPPLHSGTDAAKGTKITKAAKDARTAEAPALAFDRMPTGKTGVAFGLLDCRRGGHDVKIIDWNRTEDREAAFPYYLGVNGRKDKFFVRIGKKVGYGEWKPFLALDAEDDAFELYYTTEAKALDNKMPTADLPAPARCRVHYTGKERGGWVWLRKVAPHAIEYTVTPAKDVAPEEGKTLAKIERCGLEEMS